MLLLSPGGAVAAEKAGVTGRAAYLRKLPDRLLIHAEADLEPVCSTVGVEERAVCPLLQLRKERCRQPVRLRKNSTERLEFFVT
jgi:hypothetical protein